MAYSGSGTQSDPYLVDNGYDLLQLCGGDGSTHPGAYIKVTQDIDFAHESWYQGKITHSIRLDGTKLYADALTEIKGLTVEAQCFLYIQSNSQTIENLYFKNCCHKVSGSQFATIACYYPSAGSYTNQMVVNNCKFSLLVVSGASEGCLIFNNQSSGNGKWNNCSLYIKMNHTQPIYLCSHQQISATPSSPLCYMPFVNCNIVLDGIKLQYLHGQAYSAHYYGILRCVYDLYGRNVFGQFMGSSTSLVMKNAYINWVDGNKSPYVISNDSGSTTYASDISGCSIVFDNCTVASSWSDIYGLNAQTADTVNVVASTPNQNIDTSYSTKKISTTDIKDKNYLISIGFLP